MIFSTMSVLENIQTGLPASAHGKVPDDLYELFPVLGICANVKAETYRVATTAISNCPCLSD
jgi:ABC-type branched-subunit amino acid transport system ATPase component